MSITLNSCILFNPVRLVLIPTHIYCVKFAGVSPNPYPWTNKNNGRRKKRIGSDADIRTDKGYEDYDIADREETCAYNSGGHA